MNKTETLGYNWLKEKGYKDSEITFMSNRSPDFVCKDGRRFEVKFLYGRQILFSFPQTKQLQEEDVILVFDRKELKDQFKWGEKQKSLFNIKVLEYDENATTIRLGKETIKMLQNFKLGPRESNEDVILRLMIDETPKGEPTSAETQQEGVSNSDEDGLGPPGSEEFGGGR